MFLNSIFLFHNIFFEINQNKWNSLFFEIKIIQNKENKKVIKNIYKTTMKLKAYIYKKIANYHISLDEIRVIWH